MRYLVIISLKALLIDAIEGVPKNFGERPDQRKHGKADTSFGCLK